MSKWRHGRYTMILKFYYHPFWMPLFFIPLWEEVSLLGYGCLSICCVVWIEWNYNIAYFCVCSIVKGLFLMKTWTYSIKWLESENWLLLGVDGKLTSAFRYVSLIKFDKTYNQILDAVATLRILAWATHFSTQKKGLKT